MNELNHMHVSSSRTSSVLRINGIWITCGFVILLCPQLVMNMSSRAMAADRFVLEPLDPRVLLSASTLPDLTVARPSPEPALPASFDIFAPAVSNKGPATNTPIIAEYTRTAAADQTIALTAASLSRTGTGSDTSFLVYGQTSSTNAAKLTAATQKFATDSAVITLDANLPASSMYLMWPKNNAGYGAPVAINRTDVWWVGPNQAAPGATASAFGQNLSLGDGKSYVYLDPVGGGAGVWATVTSVNPYKVDFTVPSTLANGSYEVWIHNGHGGHYGWDQSPNNLTIVNATPWTGATFNVKNYGAKGDGVTDDQAAIQATLDAASKVAYSTIYFPSGTYTVSEGFSPTANTRWLGAGKDQTSIKLNSQFVTPATYDGRRFSLIFQGGNNVEFNGLTLDANGNLNGYTTILVRIRGNSDIRITNCRIKALGYSALDFNTSTRVFVTNTDVIGGDTFLGSATQVFIDGANFYGSNDINTMVDIWGGDGVSITRSTAQDYDNTTATGWAQGRWLYFNGGWGSNRDVYIGDNQTHDLSVRPEVPDHNSGEQISWEGHHSVFSGVPTSATSTTITFTSLPTNLGTGIYDAVIVAGRGLGQHRKVIAENGSTVTVDTPWLVSPDSSSKVIVTVAADNTAIYHNTLDGKSDYATRFTASAGIEPFGAGNGFVADSNTLHELRTGIDSWAMTGNGTLSPSYFNLYSNNTIDSCLVGVDSRMNSTDDRTLNPGVGYLGNIFRANLMSNTPTSFTINGTYAPAGHQIMMTIFDHNIGVGLPITFLYTTPIYLDTYFNNFEYKTVLE